MEPRFIVVSLADRRNIGRLQEIASQAEQIFGLNVVLDAGGFIVLADEGTPIVRLASGQGVVLGLLFDRNGHGSPPAIDKEISDRIVETKGQVLIDEYWGDYVAVVSAETAYVIRDPIGGVPCYHAKSEGVRLAFSNIAVPRQLKLVPCSIDWEMLAWTAATYDMAASRTCISGVTELLPGMRLSLLDGTEECIWSPWRFLDRGCQFKTRREAVTGLRNEVEVAARALMRSAPRGVVEISGGLDSSIVAAVLKDAGADLQCITLVTPDPGADERRYAQAMADHIGAPLKAVFLSPLDVALTDVSPVLKPRPSDHPLKRLIDLALIRTAGSDSADAFFSGSGGDHVLGYFHTSAPAADALQVHGPGKTFLKATADVAKLHRTSVWKVGRLALKKSLRESTQRSPSISPFITPEMLPPQRPMHPWERPPHKALPGAWEQMIGLSGAKNVRDGRDRSQIAPNRTPLLSQPVVEHCLRIPSWMSVHGGQNRSVAREAFADLLPPLILTRTTKGDFTELLGAIFDHNREIVRELLLGGRLREAGMIDVPSAERTVCLNGPSKDAAFVQLLTLAAIELWSRSW
ncbi:asparagine synthase-related protein [Brevundimonas sp.]|uniref:asparagine synthase-related protein n=1 Tax=Brevundimonas sp. TaxID=1871086 RepID=UPI00289A44C4|nr:asparagine synthase-related protein [Brevundimonas sp.]